MYGADAARSGKPAGDMDSAKLAVDSRNRAAAENNEILLEAVMEEYSGMLLRMACLILKDLRLAEDTVQETFINFYYSLGRFRGDAAVKTYLCRILINECRQKLRKGWLRRHILTGHPEAQVFSGTQVSLEAQAFSSAGLQEDLPAYDSAAAEAEALYGAGGTDTAARLDLSLCLQKLDVKYREVLLLHYYYGLSVKETADALGEPEGTIKSKLKRGREKLKPLLQEDLSDE